MIKYVLIGLFLLVIIYQFLKFNLFIYLAIGRYKAKKESLKVSNKEELLYRTKSLENQEWIINQSPEEITIEGYRHCMLKGHLIEAENPNRIIIAFHGWHGSWEKDFSFATKEFLDNGCSVLLVEQRAHGASGGRHIGFGILERFDCRCWTQYITNRYEGKLPIYLYGVSMGASTVLMASGLKLPNSVKGIIADCGFTTPYNMILRYAQVILQRGEYPDVPVVNYLCRKRAGYDFKEYSTLEAMKENNLPVLFVHGLKDGFVPYYMTLENFHQCKARKELFLVEGADHCRSFYKNPSEYMRKIAAFFSWGDVKVV